MCRFIVQYFMPIHQRKCINCNKIYTIPYPAYPQKYCSHKCSHKANSGRAHWNAKKNKPAAEKLRELYWDKELSSEQIAEQYGVRGTTVRNWLRGYEIPRRSLSEAKRLDMKRWSYEDRLRITAKSRFVKGVKRSHEELCKMALGRQRKAKPSKYEAVLFKELRKAGYDIVLHKAVDKFNIDIAIPKQRLAIEVHGGNWHATSKRKKAQDNRKDKVLSSLGWKVIPIPTRSDNWLSNAMNLITNSI